MEEEMSYKEKQKLFKQIYDYRGKSFWVSREKTVSGKLVGNTYNKKKEEIKKLSKNDKNEEGEK